MARRTAPLPHPSRRERIFWARFALLLIPAAVWLAGRTAGVPAPAAAFLAGLAAGMTLSPLLARATRRVIRWAHQAPPAPITRTRQEGPAK
jgi:hypothetical protein